MYLQQTTRRFAMTAALRHHHVPVDPRPARSQPAPPRRWRYGLLALLLACLAIAGAVLPMVWHLLEAFTQLPKMAWLQSLLAQSPNVSWSLMLVWGTGVSAALLATLSLRWGWKGILLIAGLTLWALAWYMHMPGIGQCRAMYGAGTVCSTWQWVFSISLALGTALYMFSIFLLGVSALGLLFTRPGELSDDSE